MEKLKGVKYLLILRIKIIFTVSFVVLFLVGCAGTSEKPQDREVSKAEKAQSKMTVSPEAQKDYEAALGAIRAGKKGKAKSLLKTLTKAYPDLSGPYTNLGLLYFHENELKEAEAAFTQAVKVNPKSAVSYNHLGIINRSTGNFKASRSYYEKALKVDANYANAHLNYGILLDLYIGEWKSALKHYERFQKLNKEEDKEVKKWIVDLKRRIKKGK